MVDTAEDEEAVVAGIRDTAAVVELSDPCCPLFLGRRWTT